MRGNFEAVESMLLVLTESWIACGAGPGKPHVVSIRRTRKSVGMEQHGGGTVELQANSHAAARVVRAGERQSVMSSRRLHELQFKGAWRATLGVGRAWALIDGLEACARVVEDFNKAQV